MLTITKNNSTSFGYCKRGGMQGIVVTIDQLIEFSKFLGTKYMDEYIPLPETTPEQQKQIIVQSGENEGSLEKALYWETQRGDHGWCCRVTGKVLQYG